MSDSTILNALLVQPELRWEDHAENRQHLESMIAKAYSNSTGRTGAGVVFLPETFTTGFLGDQGQDAESMDGETVSWMKAMAGKHDAAIGGSVVIEEAGQRFNRFLLVTPTGKVSAYDKRHLFAFQGEDRKYAPGKKRVVVDYEGWRICLQVCYDLRFPAWCRVRDDYDLLVFVANWPEKRANAWCSLLRARAIENQSYVVGVNRVGVDGRGLNYRGDTLAFDPLGEELLNLGDEAGSGFAQLDLEKLRKIRTELPFLADADRIEILS